MVLFNLFVGQNNPSNEELLQGTTNLYLNAIELIILL